MSLMYLVYILTGSTPQQLKQWQTELMVTLSQQAGSNWITI